MFKRKYNIHVYKDSHGIERKPFDIGKDGTLDELKRAVEEARGKNRSGYHKGAEDQWTMYEGAVAAFKEGRPENLQAILQDPDAFSVPERYSMIQTPSRYKFLEKAIDGAEDPAAAVTLALAGIPAEERQDMLDDLLCATVCYLKNEKLVEGLLGAGADPQADLSGFTGLTLARAIEASQTPAVIKRLVDNGADFDDAAFAMMSNNWGADNLAKLNVYKLQLFGTPLSGPAAAEASADDAELRDVIRDMRAEMKALTQEVRSLREELAAATAPNTTRAAAEAPASQTPAASAARVNYKNVLGGP